MKKIKTLIVGVIFALSTFSLHAATITGSIGFGGNVTPVDSSGNEVMLDHSDLVLDFQSPVLINRVNGDFESSINALDLSTVPVTIGTMLYINDLDVDVTTLDPFWTAGDFQFAITSLNITAQTAESLSLNGGGIVRSTNDLYEDTIGSWDITVNNLGEAVVFNFSAGSSASGQPVPEPSTYAMFGTAFAILGFVGYKKRRA